jgi:hypothetical protein
MLKNENIKAVVFTRTFLFCDIFSNYETSVKNCQEKLNESIAKIKKMEEAAEESRQNQHDCLLIEEVVIYVN